MRPNSFKGIAALGESWSVSRIVSPAFLDQILQGICSWTSIFCESQIWPTAAQWVVFNSFLLLILNAFSIFLLQTLYSWIFLVESLRYTFNNLWFSELLPWRLPCDDFVG